VLRWIYLSAAILLEVSGTLALRMATEHPVWFVLVAIGEVGSFFFLALILRIGAPIGVVYGIWAAIGTALTAVLAAVLFGDPLTWLMSAGVVLVMGGVFVVEVGSSSAAARRAAAEAVEAGVAGHEAGAAGHEAGAAGHEVEEDAR